MRNRFQSIHIRLTLILSNILIATIPTITSGEETKPPAFYLARASWDTSNFGNQTGCTLLRELVRQSLLVSAELDCGWIPRDAVMGDPAPANPSGPHLESYFKFIENQHFDYHISLKKTGRPLIEDSVPSSAFDVTVYQKVLTRAEKQARERLPDLLKTKFTPLTPSTHPTTNTYEIANLDFLTLWQQLRTWDREIWEHGESPERLSALSRGYCTFGLSTYYFFSNAPKACIARGLVYAQRMVNKYPDMPQSYYTRSYAWTLAGFDVFARDDLEKARQLNGEPPAWLPVLQTYMDSDLNHLQETMNGIDFNAQLAGLLGTFATRNWQLTTRFNDFAQSAVEKNPQNLQIYGLANEVGLNSYGSTDVSESLGAMDTMLRKRLPRMAEIDQDGRRALATPKTDHPVGIYGSIRQLLQTAEDTTSPDAESRINYPALYAALMEQNRSELQTPSIAILANLIRDTRLDFTYYRLNNQLRWRSDPTETMKQLLPDVADHPYAPLIEASGEGADVRALAKKVTLGDPGIALSGVFTGEILGNINPDFADMSYGQAHMVAWNNGDRNAFDYTSSLSPAKDHRPREARILLAASPNHYVAILYNLSDPSIRVDHLVEKYGRVILASAEASCNAGLRYLQDNRLDKARSMFENSLSIQTNRAATQALAELSLKEGDEKAWQKLMTASLKIPQRDIYALDQTKSVREIAEELLEMGQWEKAVEYSETQSGKNSDETLPLKAWLNGLQGRNEDAGKVLEEYIDNYGAEDFIATHVYLFEIPLSDDAQEAMDRLYEQCQTGNDLELERASTMALLQGNPGEAVTLLQKALTQSNDPWCGVFGALICEDQGWIERRDNMLNETAERYKKMRNPSNNRQGLKKFVDLYIRANAANELSYEGISQLAKFAYGYRDEGFDVDAHAFAGELFRLKGENDLAEQIFTDAIAPKYRRRIVEFLPYMGLRKMGTDPIQLLQEQRNQQLGHDE